MTSEIALRALDFFELHTDPADRFIEATVIVHDAALMTADEKPLNWASTSSYQ
jgi:PIN domain nuclease of toxin-antitoxin system